MPAETRATVIANGIETHYLRCGAGRTIVALGLTRSEIDTLARSCRVIAPEVIDSEACLRSFLDGLGLNEVAVVATRDLAELAQGCADADPDRVKGVISANQPDLVAAVSRLFS